MRRGKSREFNPGTGAGAGADTIQTTLDGMELRFPKVRTSDGHMLKWDREAIVKQLLRETQLSEEFYAGSSAIDEDTAREIAREAEKRIKIMGISQLSGALVREIVNQILLEEYPEQEWKNICTRVGTPVYDAHLIDIGEGFEAQENANLQDNAESLPGDEKILIKSGNEISVKPIGEIVDRVLKNAGKEGKIYLDGRSEIVFNEEYDVKAFSFNDDFTVSEVPITQFIRNEPADIYEVNTTYGKKVRVTAGHNFFCLKNEVVCCKPLSELEVGEAILMPRRIQRVAEATFLSGYKNFVQNLTLEEMTDLFILGDPLRDLVRENEKMIRGRDKNNETKNYRKCVEKCGLPLDILCRTNYMPSLAELKQLRIISWYGFEDTPEIPLYYEFTPELGEWLGLLLSEGCYSEPNKISFSNNDDLLHARFAELSKGIFGIIPRRENNSSIISKSVIPIKAIFSLHGTHSNKSVPDFMYDAPKECIEGFIRGYHAGDGKKSEMKMTTISEGILMFLRYAFLILGVVPSVYVSNRSNPKWSTSYDVGINSITKFYDLAEGGTGNYNYECGDLVSSIINEIGGVTGEKESVQLWGYGNARRGKSLSRGTIERFINDAKVRIDDNAEYVIMKEYGKSPFTPKNISELLNISTKAAYEYVKRLCGRGLCKKVEKSTKYEHSIDYNYSLTDKIFKKYEKVFKSLKILSKLINGDVAFCKIKEIKKVGREVTYDIATDTSTQNFIAGDGFLFVHNTSHKKKADKICKEQYLLLLPPKLADAHLSGDLHIHDLEYFGTRGFCQDWDLRYFFYYGLMPDGSGTKASVAGPAKKPEVAILHAVKILGSAQTNFAGGQGFFNFLTFIAPYFEGLSYEEIEQLMQMFVYEMTQMQVARGGQLVFSSVQLNPGIPKIWKDKPVVYKGAIWNGEQAPLRTYGDFEREVRLAFKALMNVMLKGDYWGKPFNFPKPEVAIEPQFLEENEEFNKLNPDLPTYGELYDLAFELTAKYGTPYFDNKIPEYRGAGEGVSCYQCCAYSFKTSPDDEDFKDKMYFQNGKHFSMGGWQVITINCPRAAYRAGGDDEKLFAELRRLMDLAVEVLKVKKRWMNKIVESGRMPFATQRPKDPHTDEKGDVAVYLDELVYIIGVVGINEMVQYHYGKQMHEDKGALRLAIRVMTEMELYAKELSEREGMEISFARTPAETVAQRFAVADILNKEFREKVLKVAKGDVEKALSQINETRDLPVYYTNGTHVPPNADISLAERIKIEHIFFPIVDGGDIMHIFLGEGYPDSRGIKSLAMKIARDTQTGYYAFTKDMTVCLDCSHVAMGLKEECEKCHSTNLDYISRITGYLQSVSGWNEGKKQELMDRMRYGANEVR